jgi:hypothetical protein
MRTVFSAGSGCPFFNWLQKLIQPPRWSPVTSGNLGMRDKWKWSWMYEQSSEVNNSRWTHQQAKHILFFLVHIGYIRSDLNHSFPWRLAVTAYLSWSRTHATKPGTVENTMIRRQMKYKFKHTGNKHLTFHSQLEMQGFRLQFVSE